MARHYYLNEDKTATPCDLMTWAAQLETMKRHIADEIHGEHRISTVWIGLNHNDHDKEPAHIFETMIFDEDMNSIYMERYSTWTEAEEGHQTAIEWLKNMNFTEEK